MSTSGSAPEGAPGARRPREKRSPSIRFRPGDLLFYASGDYINHVALYIGGGQIIHASTPKNGIMITTAYYRTPYKAVTFLN